MGFPVKDHIKKNTRGLTEINVLGPLEGHRTTMTQKFLRAEGHFGQKYLPSNFICKYMLHFSHSFFQFWAGACIPPVFPLLVWITITLKNCQLNCKITLQMSPPLLQIVWWRADQRSEGKLRAELFERKFSQHGKGKVSSCENKSLWPQLTATQCRLAKMLLPRNTNWF